MSNPDILGGYWISLRHRLQGNMVKDLDDSCPKQLYSPIISVLSYGRQDRQQYMTSVTRRELTEGQGEWHSGSVSEDTGGGEYLSRMRAWPQLTTRNRVLTALHEENQMNSTW